MRIRLKIKKSSRQFSLFGGILPNEGADLAESGVGVEPADGHSMTN
jgi:hypothetical protein